MSDSNTKVCSGGSALIFSCSGAADVGGISDLAARKLHEEGAGKMFCLAGISGGVKGILDTTRAADKILAIDGCPLDCVRLTLEKAGFSKFDHMVVTDYGLPKGQSSPTARNIDHIVEAARQKI
jgi:uncharacterized metal-binding protein